MATLTIRNVAPKVVKLLKERARAKRHSMEQEVRDLLETVVMDRSAALENIRAFRKKLKRHPDAATINRWIEVGRE